MRPHPVRCSEKQFSEFSDWVLIPPSPPPLLPYVLADPLDTFDCAYEVPGSPNTTTARVLNDRWVCVQGVGGTDTPPGGRGVWTSGKNFLLCAGKLIIVVICFYQFVEKNKITRKAQF